MERVTKLLLFLITALLVVFGSDVDGGRTIKSNGKVDHQPQTFFGGTGSTFPRIPPTPGFSGSFPTPGFTGSFPAPGFTGSFPTPGFTGSFPRPGLGSSSPSFGFGPPGSSSFCAFFPGTAGCTPGRHTVSGGPVGGASP